MTYLINNDITSIMKRAIDYDWFDTREIEEIDFKCGFCGSNITTKTGYVGWINIIGQHINQNIYICHKCGLPNFFAVNNSQHPVYNADLTIFPDSVKAISSQFIEIHRQAYIAEVGNLNEIAGMGYGKALEFLIKDYLIKNIPDKEDEIKNTKLYDCIHNLLNNPKIKILADKARLIRNDETHYERKNENSDIDDLKNLIGATVAWIDLESYTNSISENL